jgi:hypothetical protein
MLKFLGDVCVHGDNEAFSYFGWFGKRSFLYTLVFFLGNRYNSFHLKILLEMLQYKCNQTAIKTRK